MLERMAEMAAARAGLAQPLPRDGRGSRGGRGATVGVRRPVRPQRSRRCRWAPGWSRRTQARRRSASPTACSEKVVAAAPGGRRPRPRRLAPRPGQPPPRRRRPPPGRRHAPTRSSPGSCRPSTSSAPSPSPAAGSPRCTQTAADRRAVGPGGDLAAARNLAWGWGRIPGVDFRLAADDDPRRWRATEHPAPDARAELAGGRAGRARLARSRGASGAEPEHRLIIDEELRRAGVERPDNPIGIGWAGPTLAGRRRRRAAAALAARHPRRLRVLVPALQRARGRLRPRRRCAPGPSATATTTS